MGTLTEKLQKLANTKAAIKAAIIAKGQSISNTDTFASYADKIAAIQTGADTSDATVSAGDIKQGKIAYGSDGKITGSMPNVSMAAVSASLNHDSGKLAITKNQAESGYVESGTSTAEVQLDTLSAKTYTPGTATQTISKYQWLTGDQTIKGDANLVAGNIKSGVSIFGVNGTVTELNHRPASITVRCYTTDPLYMSYQTDEDPSGFNTIYMDYGEQMTITTYVGAWIFGQIDGYKSMAYNMSGVGRVGPGDVDCVYVTASSGSVYFGDF